MRSRPLRAASSWRLRNSEQNGPGTAFDNDHTVLTRDTPKDVEAELVADVRVVGVATGETTMRELRNVGATVVLERLDATTVKAALDH
jgi:phosphoglycolate phosphatase